MNSIVCSITLAKVGLILNFIGTIMIALSFGKNLEEAHQEDKKGRRVYLASFLYPRAFYVGCLLLAVGFLLQLLG